MNRSIFGCMLIQSQNVLNHIYPSFVVHLLSMAYYRGISKDIYLYTSLYMSIGGLLGGRIVPSLKRRFSYRALLFVSLLFNSFLFFGQSFVADYISHFLIFFLTGANHNFLYYLANHIGNIFFKLNYSVFFKRFIENF